MNLSRKTYFTLMAFVLLSIPSMGQSSNNSKGETDAFVQIIQDPNINVLNKQFKDYNSKHNDKVDGYRIQIYYGTREEASRQEADFKTFFPKIKTSLIYEEPNFKTFVGYYLTKLDADRELQKIKTKYPDAFILKDKIDSF